MIEPLQNQCPPISRKEDSLEVRGGRLVATDQDMLLTVAVGALGHFDGRRACRLVCPGAEPLARVDTLDITRAAAGLESFERRAVGIKELARIDSLASGGRPDGPRSTGSEEGRQHHKAVRLPAGCVHGRLLNWTDSGAAAVVRLGKSAGLLGLFYSCTSQGIGCQRGVRIPVWLVSFDPSRF